MELLGFIPVLIVVGMFTYHAWQLQAEHKKAFALLSLPPSSPSPAIEQELAKVVALVQTTTSVIEKTLASSLKGLSKDIEQVPSKTLHTIQGSVNTTTGKLGEILQFMELQKSYDRFIVLGNIVDFIGIKFETEDSPGVIELLDVKTGKRAVLSEDQKKLRSLVESFNKQLPDGLAPLVVFKVLKGNVTE